MFGSDWKGTRILAFCKSDPSDSGLYDFEQVTIEATGGSSTRGYFVSGRAISRPAHPDGYEMGVQRLIRSGGGTHGAHGRYWRPKRKEGSIDERTKRGNALP